jgi:hypothetical protein
VLTEDGDSTIVLAAKVGHPWAIFADDFVAYSPGAELIYHGSSPDLAGTGYTGHHIACGSHLCPTMLGSASFGGTVTCWQLCKAITGRSGCSTTVRESSSTQ